jgi:drug/metabolite transporter (DMT)-like permease
LALGFLTLFITPVNLACQNLALRDLEASQVANFSNASPILTVAWGAWLFGEPLTTSLILGGALTLGGIAWTTRSSVAGGRTVFGGQRSLVSERERGSPRVLPAVSPDFTGH